MFGGGKCSLCGSPGTNKSSCPLLTGQQSHPKHPNASAMKSQPQPQPQIQPQIQQRIVPIRPSPIKPLTSTGPFKVHLKPKQVRQVEETRLAKQAREARNRCVNPTTFLGDDVNDIPAEYFYQSPSGYCYDINELFDHIIASGDYMDPYTRDPLWTDDAGMKAIIEHPGLDQDKRQKLRFILFNEKPIVSSTVDLLYNRVDILQQIGMVGLTLLGNYDVTQVFADCRDQLQILSAMIDTTYSDKPLLLALKVNIMGTGEFTLNNILEMSQNTCIHTIGFYFLYFYSHYWHMLKLNGINVPLPQGLMYTVSPNALLIFTYNRSIERAFIAIHIYDEESLGANSKMGYIAVLDWIYGDFHTHLTHVTNENSPNMDMVGIRRPGSQIYFPTQREMSIYAAVQGAFLEQVEQREYYVGHPDILTIE